MTADLQSDRRVKPLMLAYWLSLPVQRTYTEAALPRGADRGRTERVPASWRARGSGAEMTKWISTADGRHLRGRKSSTQLPRSFFARRSMPLEPDFACTAVSLRGVLQTSYFLVTRSSLRGRRRLALVPFTWSVQAVHWTKRHVMGGKIDAK